MTQEEKIRADLANFNATGELPEAWEPTRYVDDEEFDRRLDEINMDDEIAAELEAIESGSVEPPRFGWLCQIGQKT